MDKKYKGLSEQDRWIEYGRLKREFTETYGYVEPAVYDAFIARITKSLGL